MSEHPIYRVELTKEMKNTGSSEKPFYAKIAEHTRVYLFGILIKKVSSTGDFPENKK